MTIPWFERAPLAARREIRRAVILTLLAGGAGALTPALAAEAPAPAEDESAAESTPEAAELKNWIELSLGATGVSGDDAAMRARTGLPKGVYGGISGFHFEQEVATNTVFKADARGLFDNHDYNLRLELTREELGYVRAGYREFRTYSDGSGGFVPGLNVWPPQAFDDALELDRREFWFEAGLRKPKWPEFTLRYSHQERDGTKASTSWGDVTTASGIRKVAGAYLDLDETRDLVSLDARKTIGKTDVTLGFRYERSSLDDSRNLRFFPGEGVLFDQYATQSESVDSDLFSFHAAGDHRLSERVRFTVGYAYTDLDSEVSGYRAYGTAYDPDLVDRLPNAATFDALDAQTGLSQHVANVNLHWAAGRGLDVIPSLRFELQDTDGHSVYDAPGAPLAGFPFSAASERGLLDVSEALEVRYSGLTNWVLFARGEWLQGRGDLDETWDNVATASSLITRSSDDERDAQKYSLGASWYPIHRLSLSGGYYHKIRNNNFDHSEDSTPNTPGTPNRYPAFLRAQEYTVDDLNARLTWRPRGNLTLVGRYDYQVGTLDTEADQLGDIESADLTSHVFGASASWTFLKRAWLQGHLTWVEDTTETPATAGLSTHVQESENDYWTAQLTLGCAASDAIDLEASYFYYRADNFAANATDAQPFGAGLEEHGINATATWRINPRVRWLLRYGFLTSAEDATDGHNDYDVHLVSSSLQYRF